MKPPCPTCGRAYTKPRSLNQNSYMWSVVYKYIADYTGHSTEEIHACCKQMFLPKDHLLMGKDVEVVIPKSTKNLSTVELEEFLTRVRVWASTELSLNIPLPNQSDDIL